MLDAARKILRETTNYLYSAIMTNTNNAEAFSTQKARAAYLRELTTSQRWTGRKIALATGVPSSTIATKLNGSTTLDVDDVALFARVLEMDPGELYKKLLEVDSNHQPAGSQSAASNRGLAPVTTLKPRHRPAPLYDTSGLITPLHAHN